MQVVRKKYTPKNKPDCPTKHGTHLLLHCCMAISEQQESGGPEQLLYVPAVRCSSLPLLFPSLQFAFLSPARGGCVSAGPPQHIANAFEKIARKAVLSDRRGWKPKKAKKGQI